MANFVQTANAGRAIANAWTLTNADATGQGLSIPGAPDRTVQLVGTFGGATVVIQGSNDNSNWNTLHAPDGSELSFTATAIMAILENPLHIRPFLSGGAGSTVTVLLASRS